MITIAATWMMCSSSALVILPRFPTAHQHLTQPKRLVALRLDTPSTDTSN